MLESLRGKETVPEEFITGVRSRRGRPPCNFAAMRMALESNPVELRVAGHFDVRQ